MILFQLMNQKNYKVYYEIKVNHIIENCRKLLNLKSIIFGKMFKIFPYKKTEIDK